MFEYDVNVNVCPSPDLFLDGYFFFLLGIRPPPTLSLSTFVSRTESRNLRVRVNVLQLDSPPKPPNHRRSNRRTGIDRRTTVEVRIESPTIRTIRRTR